MAQLHQLNDISPKKELKYLNMLNQNNIESRRAKFWIIKQGIEWSCSHKETQCSRNTSASFYYLGATDPRLHSASREGRTAGLSTAVWITSNAIAQFFSCFSRTTEETFPKAIMLCTGVIAVSRYGSSISTRKSSWCLASWNDKVTKFKSLKVLNQTDKSLHWFFPRNTKEQFYDSLNNTTITP